MRAALVALLLVGCAYGPLPEEGFVGSTTFIDPAFTDEERAIIVESFARWAAVTRGPLQPGWSIVRVAPGKPSEIGHSDAGMRTIWIRPGISQAQFRWSVLHELGHAHGMWRHVDRGVMQAWMAEPPYVDFTPEDLAECRREGVC